MTLRLRKRWNLREWSSLAVYGALLEAAVLVVCARVAVLVCFRRVSPWVFGSRVEGDRRPGAEMEMVVGRSVATAVRLLRWKDCCLPAAMAGKMMLARRGFRSTIHLGVGKRASGALHAHAWLEAGGEVLTGELYVEDVTAIRRDRQPV